VHCLPDYTLKHILSHLIFYNTTALSLIPDQVTGHLPDPLQEAPQASWVATPAAPDRALDSVAPDILPFHQHHCNVDKWRSLDIQYGADRPPTTKNGQYTAVPL